MAPRSDGYPVLFVGCLEDVAACPPQQFDSFLNKARKSQPRLTGRGSGDSAIPLTSGMGKPRK